MGNFLCADEDPASAFARVAPYAYYVHAKDFIVKPFKAERILQTVKKILD